MKLWIRSQNKELLIKVNCIFIEEIDNLIVLRSFCENKEVYLGTYTYKRAIEVLDTIQNLLQNAYVGNSGRIVYEMPEE